MALKTICLLLFTESETGTYHFKLLVPSVAAGAIIGKGGETIAQLQREKHAKVKMSKANDFYPGTRIFNNRYMKRVHIKIVEFRIL